MKVSLKAGADVNVTDKLYRTALMWAATWGHEKCVDLLIGEDADADMEDTDGKTALIKTKNYKCACALISAGADINKQDERGGLGWLL